MRATCAYIPNQITVNQKVLNAVALIKTPFIVYWQNGFPAKGAVCKGLISAVDIAPTLLDIAGVEPPAFFQGQSFAGLFKDPNRTFRKYVFAEHNWHDYEALERSVRDSAFLYILNERPFISTVGAIDINQSPSAQALRNIRHTGSPVNRFSVPQPAEQLYHLSTDPDLRLNLADDAAYAAQLKRLQSVMARWRAETGDTSPAHLTPDWYDRETSKPKKAHGIRGEMPGASEGASYIIRPGPF